MQMSPVLGCSRGRLRPLLRSGGSGAIDYDDSLSVVPMHQSACSTISTMFLLSSDAGWILRTTDATPSPHVLSGHDAMACRAGGGFGMVQQKIARWNVDEHP